MNADTLKRLFTPFFTTKGPSKGTGLGLSIVKRTISAHQGEIEVESMLQKGTAFHILFPVVKAGEIAAERLFHTEKG